MLNILYDRKLCHSMLSKDVVLSSNILTPLLLRNVLHWKLSFRLQQGIISLQLDEIGFLKVVIPVASSMQDN